MGRPGMAEKRRNPTTQGGGRRRVRRPDLGAAAVRREISRPRSSGGGAPTRVARASRRWPETSPMAKTRLARKRVETTQFRSTGLGEFF